MVSHRKPKHAIICTAYSHFNAYAHAQVRGSSFEPIVPATPLSASIYQTAAT